MYDITYAYDTHLHRLSTLNNILKYTIATSLLGNNNYICENLPAGFGSVPWARRKKSTRLKLGYKLARVMTICSEGDVITPEHSYVDILNTAVMWLTTRVVPG